MIRGHIVITGVSSGIGLDIAKHLVSNQFKVYGSVRKEEVGQSLITTLGPLFVPLVFDVTDSDAIGKARDFVKQDLNENNLVGLVNNAGIACFGPLLHVPIEAIRNQLDINVVGVIRMIQSFVPLFGAKNGTSKNGKVININSVSGRISNPFLGPYCASKFALRAINDTLRMELSIYGIKVISLEPGPIKSSIWEKASHAEDYGKGTDYEKWLLRKNQIIEMNEKRALPPSAISKTVLKILKSSNPKTNYLITKHKILFKIFASLPDKVKDKLITRQFFN